ncbi:MAG TPA: prepilin-type N-terminal cleavage/methylation domain-containing protein [Fimbriimonadales bacterium]|nr:prepilin-type N-terminal cleavage/methylation domain-containing protein [Fimbriimonadales bacterium]
MNNRRSVAFTLVELLVVCAILAILAAILFPVFRSAVTSAKSRVCQSNFTQVGAALLLYEIDYDDTLPPTNYRRANPSLPDDDRTWVQTLLPYAGSLAIFQCPSDTGRQLDPPVGREGWKDYYTASLHSNVGFNFMYLSPIIKMNGIWEAHPIRGSAVGNQSATIAFIDSIWDRNAKGDPVGGGSWIVSPPCRYVRDEHGSHDSFNLPASAQALFGFEPVGWQPAGSASWLVYGGAWPWHRGRFTVLFLDGRAASVPLAELIQGCSFQPNWNGLITSTSEYLWDIQD